MEVRLPGEDEAERVDSDLHVACNPVRPDMRACLLAGRRHN